MTLYGQKGDLAIKNSRSKMQLEMSNVSDGLLSHSLIHANLGSDANMVNT